MGLTALPLIAVAIFLNFLIRFILREAYESMSYVFNFLISLVIAYLTVT